MIIVRGRTEETLFMNRVAGMANAWESSKLLPTDILMGIKGHINKMFPGTKVEIAPRARIGSQYFQIMIVFVDDAQEAEFLVRQSDIKIDFNY